jgi:hypothetical protein
MKSRGSAIALFVVAVSCAPSLAQGAFAAKEYRNVFKELGYADAAIEAKVDEAYIMDIAHGDVRSEGMSYGMMMCVQLDKKAELRLFRVVGQARRDPERYRAGPRRRGVLRARPVLRLAQVGRRRGALRLW